MRVCRRCLIHFSTESGRGLCPVCEPSVYAEGDKKENPKAVQAAKDGKAPLDYLVYSVLEDDEIGRAHV